MPEDHDMVLDDGESEVDMFAKHLTKNELNAISKDYCLNIRSVIKNVKADYIKYLLGAGKRFALRQAVIDRQQRRSKLYQAKNQRHNAQKRETNRHAHETRILSTNIIDDEEYTKAFERFMVAPSKDELREIYRSVYLATSNEALKHHVCAVCGRERMTSEMEISVMKATAIPNSQRLRLAKCQEGMAVDYICGMLLAKRGCQYTEGDTVPDVTVCRECLTQLTVDAKDGQEIPPPQHSFANGLWYGEVPHCLRVLTLPERLLIARIYPRVYVIKLQPKQGRRHFNPETLQTALVGNVISFDHNTDKVADMIEGNIMPHKPSILASLISIAFVSAGPVNRAALRRTFNIRRKVVDEALVWLQQHNRYYEDIKISKERLAALPVDDVVDEIFDVIREESNPIIADHERGGYVPLYDDIVKGLPSVPYMRYNPLKQMHEIKN